MPRFSALVKQSFDPTTVRLGLKRVRVGGRSFRYENHAVFVVLHFDEGRSFELGLEIGRRSQGPECAFSLSEILRFRGIRQKPDVDGLAATTDSALRDGLRLLAQLTEVHAQKFLGGDPTAFAELAEQRRKESDAYALDRDLRAARHRAAIAWRARDYAEVISALRPLSAHLTASELKQLDYSQRHV